MISDYLYAIGKYLPVYEKTDILKKIEGDIYDYLEAEFGKKEYTNEEIESTLMNMGSPKRVAYAYTGKERHLIDPVYLDVYLLVTKVAIFGISIAFAVIAILSLTNSESLLTVLLGFLSNVWEAGLMMIGIVTIIFAVISKYDIGKRELTEEYKDWSIKDLKKAPTDVNRVKISDIIIESILIVLFLTFINSPSFDFGVKYNEFLLALNIEVFSRFIIWINITLIFNLALNAFLLIKRKWSTFSRILSIISDFIGLGILGVLTFHPNLIDSSKISELPLGVVENVKFGISIGFRIGFLAVFIITFIEVYKHIRIIVKTIKKN